ncbi:zinc-binding dehydrogenase [Bradyrhizobium shewense]|uniref:zinc-binding dehydrogenase n=1 Tax=Bradyrhizobium shewense TaxID=1761772 RepID=UPI003D31AF38
MAGQLAKQRGARVIGIAPRDGKCKFVTHELDFDACLSHLSPSLSADLAAVCQAGIDVYFENVGGEVFEAVLPLFNQAARMTICDLIARYGDEDGGVHRRAAQRTYLRDRFFDQALGSRLANRDCN